ncbi:Uncharacterised protein [Mycobacteroides abscessus subsp. abscessus]|nr:Uncharacterised protein [Mycobacteroides abscessus subsp. abscessus]
MGEYRRQAGACANLGYPARRPGRFQRHKRGTGLQYGKQGHREVRRPLHIDPDKTVVTDVEGTQQRGQPSGMLIQLTVAKVRVLGHDRQGIRILSDMPLKKFVQWCTDEMAGVVGGIPVVNNALVLTLGE